MSVNKNIGLFNECFPPVMDGVSVCVQNYAYWLQKKVGGVSVVTPRNHGVKYKEDYEVLDYISVPVPFRKPYVTGVAELDPIFVGNLLMREFKIVHAHSPFMSGHLAKHVATVQRIPMVATFHSKYRDDFSRVIPGEFAVDQIVRYIVDFYEKADEVWVPQESVKSVLYDYGFKGPVEVVDNGCDLCGEYDDEYFAKARQELGIKQGELMLLFVGQHIWEKNTRLIINAITKLKDIPFRMFFVGVGYAEDEMKQLVRDAGLEDRVTFVGSVKERERIARYYAAADLFLFPSLYDNAPLVVREAAALHTPSVMVRGATASTIIDDGHNGFLVSNDADDFASTIRSLSSDRDLLRRAGLEASCTIVRSWEDVCTEVLERYNALISRQKLISY